MFMVHAILLNPKQPFIFIENAICLKHKAVIYVQSELCISNILHN
jgi:hypothetical protein